MEAGGGIVTDDPWDRDEYRLFGRAPTADDLLDRHLARTGGVKAVREDPMAKLQVTILREFLGVLEAALADEHIDPGVARRVVERVIYGGVPSYVEVEERLRQMKAFADQLRIRPTSIVIPDQAGR